MTAYPEELAQDEITDAGAVAYLRKPFSPGEVLNALKLAGFELGKSVSFWKFQEKKT
jgi:CheY-like chemotaxis protein